MTDDTAATTDALEDDPRPDGLRSATSLVLVNTGNGKGKSSSAFGVMLRALAVDWPVAVVQFVKSGDWKVGEEKMGRQLGVDWHAFGHGFTWDSDDLDTRQGTRQRGVGGREGADHGRRAPARRPRRTHLSLHAGGGSTSPM